MSGHCAHRRRRGISLVELLLAISAATILIGLSTRMIHRVMHAHSKATAFQHAEQTALRLSSQFRSDVHAARAAVIEGQDEDKGLKLTGSGPRRVEYRPSNRSLIRTVIDGEKTVARDDFAFPNDFTLRIEQLEAPVRVLLVVESESHSPSGASSRQQRSAAGVPLAIRIEACLARRSGSDETHGHEAGTP